ncbi:plasmid mobilization protein, partial [Ralstonia solanacearum]|uniref:plasmid mobilization protein n=1 Tax=Ralstonia solanacearum TaxID=305 RepID=UPI00399D6530
MADAGRASAIGQQQGTVQWPAGTRLEGASQTGAPASQGTRGCYGSPETDTSAGEGVMACRLRQALLTGLVQARQEQRLTSLSKPAKRVADQESIGRCRSSRNRLTALRKHPECTCHLHARRSDEMAATTERIVVRVTTAQKRAIVSTAKRLGLNVSELMRQAIQDFTHRLIHNSRSIF